MSLFDFLHKMKSILENSTKMLSQLSTALFLMQRGIFQEVLGSTLWLKQKCVPQRTFFGKVKLRHSEGEKSPSGATAGKDRGAGTGPYKQGRRAGCPAGDRTERRVCKICCGQCFLDRMEWTCLGQHCGSRPHLTMFWLYNPQQVAQKPWGSVSRST